MSEFDQLLPPMATLVAFEAAFRHRNFSRAAEELFQSQTTVSRRVRALEEDLGVRLFERHRYDVTPTAQAEELAVSVRLSLRELSSTADRIRRCALETESLTILTSLSLTSATVAPVLGGFQQRHPELNIRVVSSCEPIETTQEQFDVALQYGPSDSDRFQVEFIAEEAVFPVCSPSFAARLPNTIGGADLLKLPLLHTDYDDPSWVTWPDLLAAAGVEQPGIDRTLVFTSYQVCLDVAERGDGVALGWEHSVSPRIDAGTLVRVPGLSMPRAGRINAYIADRASSNDHASEFVALLRAAMSSH